MGVMHKLIIEDDEGKTTVVPVSRGEISIGRMEGNTIRLMERNVSRRHARLLRDNGAIFIEDLNSFNGVKINGERIDRRLEIKEGDLVEIGDYHLALQRVEIEDEPPASRADTVVAREQQTQDAPVNGQKEAQWRASLAGTVPDFRLPQEILAEARAELDRAGSGAGAGHAGHQGSGGHAPLSPAALPETVRDLTNGGASMRQGGGAAPSSPPPGFAQPDPLVSPPPKESRSQPPLPPFPASGLTSPSALGAGTVSDVNQVPAVKRDDASSLRTEQIQVGPSRVSDVPRLVCVSTEYAGREFSLNRPEVIIGRVEDNDVVIEHRSVSRNHAKILYDGRVHKIIDLESANGILVNGEEYAITDLRKNDLIELGHVKFRFVPSGEVFAPTEDEAKAMLEAGVAPPATRSLEPPTMPHKQDGRSALKDLSRTEEASTQAETVELQNVGSSVDPSSAATVTDTPISALGVSELFQPKVAPPEALTEPPGAPEPQAPRPMPAMATVPSEAAHTRAQAEPASAGFRSAPAAATRPSAQARQDTLPDVAARSSVRVGGTAADRRVGLRDPASPKDDDDDDLRGAPASSGKGKVIAAVLLVAMLLAGLVYGLMKLGGGPNSHLDDQLQALYDQGDYSGVQAFYLEHSGSFEDRQKAFDLASAAAVAAKKREEKRAADAKAVADPKPTPPEPPPELIKPVGELPEGEEDVAEDPPDPVTKRSPRKRREKKPDPKTHAQEVHKLATLGFRAMNEADDPAAERYLKECLRRQPNHPECLRYLGALYMRRNEQTRAAEQFEKYLQHWPNNPDSDRIRNELKTLRDSGYVP